MDNLKLMRACRASRAGLSAIHPRPSTILTRPIYSRSLSTSPNMALWNPRHSTPGFSSLFRMLDDFEKHAQQAIIGRPMGSTFSDGLQTFAPKFDVTEHEKNYVLQGELPGVPPENVAIEFTDPQTMVVRGHAKREHTEGDPSLGRVEEGKEPEKIEGGNGKKTEAPKEAEKPGPRYWLSERSYGEFSRVFNFPAGVDQDKVEAKFENGVLNITVPKVEKKGVRKIEIN
ncbi:HSP20-like chaperone [Lasiosphaeris hirsuta]|uniref:HSP20-like chaperone n=1 Tax=Lasiosphaeris hirsuta TaxID=260670 RepID=A0AA40E9V3_9PEZI|nr:HSP20-like chaperone [Lasiosphaeris hirsuta]